MALRDNGFIAKSHISRRWKIQFTESPGWLCTQRQPVYAQEDMGACGKCIWSPGMQHRTSVLKPKGSSGKGGSWPKLQSHDRTIRSPVMTWKSPTTPRPAPETAFLSGDNKPDGKLLKRLKYVALLQRLCGSRKEKKSALIDLLACHVPVLSKSSFVCLFVCKRFAWENNHSGFIFNCYNAEKIYTSFQRHLPKEAKEVSGI